MKPCNLLYYVYVITEQTNLMKKNNDNNGTYYVNYNFYNIFTLCLFYVTYILIYVSNVFWFYDYHV